MEALGAKRASLEGQLAAAAAGGADGFSKVEALSKQLAQVGGRAATTSLREGCHPCLQRVE